MSFTDKNGGMLLALGLGMAATLAGCGRGPAQTKSVPPAVTVAPVERKEIVEQDEFTGRTAHSISPSPFLPGAPLPDLCWRNSAGTVMGIQ